MAEHQRTTETLTQECEGENCGKIVKYDVRTDQPRDAIPLPDGWVYWRGKVLCLNCKTLPEAVKPHSDGAAR